MSERVTIFEHPPVPNDKERFVVSVTEKPDQLKNVRVSLLSRVNPKPEEISAEWDVFTENPALILDLFNQVVVKTLERYPEGHKAHSEALVFLGGALAELINPQR